MKLCYCGRAHLDPQECDYVVDGRPLCDADCYRRAQRERTRVRAARNVPLGTSWAFREHRTMAEVIAAETRIVTRDDGHFDVIGP